MPPKNKGESTTRPNRIRFIMLDADISDGNLSELTAAITNALKPSGQYRQLPAPPPPPKQITNGDDPIEEIDEAEESSKETPITNPQSPIPNAPPLFADVSGLLAHTHHDEKHRHEK